MLRTALVAAVLAACGPAPRPAPLSSTAAPDQYVVWYEVPTPATGDEPATVTYRSARLDADGKVLGERDGAILVANNAVWTVARRAHTEPAPSCKELGDPDGDPEPGSASLEILELVEQGGARTVPLTQRALPHDMVAAVHEIDASNAIVASLGPYVFVRGATSDYACGAHPSASGTAAIIDARTGREVIGLSKDEQAALQAAANAAVDADIGGMGDGDAVRFDEGKAAYAATEPSWEGGALHAKHLWYASTCYACGNGEWDSYTWGTWVESRVWPKALTEVTAIPPAVGAWIATHGGAVGVSWADPGLAARAVP